MKHTSLLALFRNPIIYNINSEYQLVDLNWGCVLRGKINTVTCGSLVLVTIPSTLHKSDTFVMCDTHASRPSHLYFELSADSENG